MDDRNGLQALTQAFFRLLERGDAWLNRNLHDFLGDLPGGNWLLLHCRITSRGLFLACMALLLLFAVPPLTEWMLRRVACLAANFRGDRIPQCYGFAVLVTAGTLLALDAWLFPAATEERLLWLACVGGFGALGFLDDRLGDKKVKGLRGHLRALTRDHRITTGLIKAAGGLLIALWIGYRLHAGQILPSLLAAAVIALGANAMNLLDLRPGRACGVFCAAGALLLAEHWRRSSLFGVPGLLYVALPAPVAWLHDADGRVMLGDTGSNLLGAALGLGVCAYLGTLEQIIALSGLCALHVLAERTSITQLIEKHPALRALDRLTGMRAPNDAEDSSNRRPA